jgi:hypothetical protein
LRGSGRFFSPLREIPGRLFIALLGRSIAARFCPCGYRWQCFAPTDHR